MLCLRVMTVEHRQFRRWSKIDGALERVDVDNDLCLSVEVGNHMWTTNRIAWCHEAVMSGRVLRMAICVRHDETNKHDHVVCLL